MKQSILIPGCIISLFLLFFCKHSTTPSDDVIYFTSFESEKDIKGWHNLSLDLLVSDPSPGGGKKSLHFRGADWWPSAYLDLPPHYSGKEIMVSCWGKWGSGPGGEVLLVVYGGGQGASAEIVVRFGQNQRDWTFLSSRKALLTPPGKKLQLIITAGGFIGGSVFLDQLAVKVVD